MSTDPEDQVVPRLRAVASQLGHARSASEIMAEALRRLIVSGALPAGHRLPRERELAAALGASRLTVRRALHELEAQHLVEIRRGRSGGAVVRAPAGLNARGGVDYEEALRESHELRLAIEPVTAALAAERATPAERRSLLARSRRATPSLAAYQTADHDLHLAIAQAARSQALVRALESHFGELFIWANSPFLNAEAFEKFHDFRAEHEDVAAAIGDGDSKRARAAMTAHLERVDGQIREAFALVSGSS
jgi:GntR family transcriptional regulator, transcriptional repressor for pyruvate dehydrogenase complex